VLDLITDLHVDGARVWHSTSTYLVRGQGDPSAAPLEPPPIADLTPGPVRWQIAADTGRRYAAVSGDRNPIHLSALTARPFGFQHAIAHGMWSYARVMAHTAAGMPSAGTSTVWFRAPIPLPSTVSLATADHGRQVALLGPDGSTVHLVTQTQAMP
jgi:acyl dehydratase